MTNLEKLIQECADLSKLEYLGAVGDERFNKLLEIIKVQNEALDRIQDVKSGFNLTRKRSYLDYELREIAQKALEKTEQIAVGEE